MAYSVSIKSFCKPVDVIGVKKRLTLGNGQNLGKERMSLQTFFHGL